MKTRPAQEKCGFLRHVILTLRAIIDALMPVRQKSAAFPDNLSRTIHAKNEARIFSPAPYSYCEDGPDGFTRALFPYRDPDIKRFIWNLKYRLSPESTVIIGRILADELIADLGDTLSHLPLNGPAYIIYAPSSAFASGKRADDQMKIVALAAEGTQNAACPFFSICINAVRISKDMTAQHAGSKKDRLSWSKERYSLSPAFLAKLKADPFVHIICIDDILTTGATLSAIKNLTLDGGAHRVDCLTLTFAELSRKARPAIA